MNLSTKPSVHNPHHAALIFGSLVLGLSENAIGVKLGVKRGGCNGFTYSLGFADKISRTDEVVETEGVKVVIEPKAVFYVLGT